jgi:hypothetical protein
MPAGPGEDAERFAAAVELGRSPDSWLDDELARDLEIVAMLRSRTRDFDPSPAAKAQAKQRLMALLAEPGADERPEGGRVLAPAFGSTVTGAADNAVTEMLPQVPDASSGDARPDGSRSTEPQSAEPGPVETTRPDLDGDADIDLDVEPGAHASGHGVPSRPTRLSRSRRARNGRHSRPDRPAGRAGNAYPIGAAGRRFTLVGSAALVLALALAGAGILVSRDALPGEGLYGVKRVAEQAGLALTFDEASKARRHLDLASTRLGEVEQLVAADPAVGSQDPQLVTEAIRQFDDSAGEGARIMLAGENNADNSGARDELRSWAAEQSTRLAGLQPVLPAGAGAEDALQLLNRVVGRTAALQQQDACATPPNSVDDLGPVPSCQPTGVEAAGVDPTTGLPRTASDAATAGATDDPATAGGTAGADPRGTAGSSASSGGTTSPNTSRQAPAQQDDPGLLDPVEDTLGGVLGGGSKDTQSSTAPSSSDDDRTSSDNGGGGLPPINLPLPGLGGLGLG